MTYLNKKQLAFILDIKVEDARAMMCNAWEKSKGIEKKGFAKEIAGAERDGTKIKDKYPEAMLISLLSENLNVPHLQAAADDIEKNYLIRPASKKWILCDYPEKQIKAGEGTDKMIRLQIPPALRTMLPDSVQKEIREVWSKRYLSKTVSIA